MPDDAPQHTPAVTAACPRYPETTFRHGETRDGLRLKHCFDWCIFPPLSTNKLWRFILLFQPTSKGEFLYGYVSNSKR
jgi:hypothetical protein